MTQHGESDLAVLLASMRPTLDPETFVFLTTTQSISTLPLEALQPQMLFQEAEGLSIITSQTAAEAHGFLDPTFPCRKISLTVHSSLEAVGLIASIATRFAENGISSNVVSGYFHDHIFVPVGKEEAAMKVLQEMMKEAKEKVRA
ncbi:hypothetical protein ASPZODRAFT_11465 [Penicilliopsis zonata CBS 506.65]|uniref:Uncharacterized protein n=1 Tax=Penicilliopsis zonata CBS 506.65 TaxID=1073090 RepID=A0A1L9STS6_9EURO|nr:hypothetical protein ASPZODRAFT_11465 [Penicilliopsis zonata CBS 506.65]OJJ50599.1 hypothetical protein ASPZODRAFT_11465 [Penicilliopsis zonata CBS 506.65]